MAGAGGPTWIGYAIGKAKPFVHLHRVSVRAAREGARAPAPSLTGPSIPENAPGAGSKRVRAKRCADAQRIRGAGQGIPLRAPPER
jgi:hypothetical protein